MLTRTTHRTPGRPLAFAAALVILALSGSGSADHDVLPGPISTQDLDQYAAILSLSEAQLERASRLHYDYLVEWRATRRQQFEPFATSVREMVSDALFELDPPTEWRDFRSQRSSLLTRVEQLDASLLNGLAELLTDTQQAALERVRAERMLERQRDTILLDRSLDSDYELQLSAVLREVDLSAAGRAAADPLLDEYATRMITAIEMLVQKILDIFEQYARELAALGFDADWLENSHNRPDAERDEYFQQAARIWIGLSRDVHPAAVAVHELRHDTMQRLLAALPADDVAHARSALYFALHRVRIGDATAAVRFAERELEDHRSEDAARQIITRVAQEDALLAGRLVECSNDRVGADVAGVFDPEKEQTLRQRRDQLHQQRRDLHAAGLRELIEAAGAELARQIMARLTTPVTQPMLDDDSEAPSGPPPPPTDSYVARPISSDDIVRWAQWLEMDEAQRSLAVLLHRDYQRAVTGIQQTQLAELADLFIGFRINPETSMGEFSSVEDVDRKYELRHAVRQQIATLDDQLLADLRALLDADEATRFPLIRLDRSGASQASGMPARLAASGFHEMYINLTQIVTSEAVPSQALGDCIAALLVHVDTLQAAIAHHASRELEAMHARDRMMATQWDRDALEEAAGQLRAARTGLLTTIRSAWNAIIAAAGHDTTLANAYRASAYPELWQHAGDTVADLLERASGLRSLSGEQHAALSEIRFEFADERETAIADAIEILRDPDIIGLALTSDGWDRAQSQQSSLQHLYQDLDDLTSAITARLERLLTEDQRQELDFR